MFSGVGDTVQLLIVYACDVDAGLDMHCLNDILMVTDLSSVAVRDADGSKGPFVPE